MKKTFLLTYIFLLQTAFFSGAAIAEPDEQSAITPNVQSQAVYWYEGDKKRVIWKSVDEIAFLPQHNPSVMAKTAKYQQHSVRKMKQDIGTSFPGAKIIDSSEAWSRVKLADQESADNYLKLQKQARSKNKSSKPAYTNVYYNSKSKGSKPLIATGELIVHFKEKYTQEMATQWGQEYGLEKAETFNLGSAFVYVCGNSDNCLEKSNTAYHDSEVKYAYPNWIRPVSKQLSQQRIEINDTLFPEQWYLENKGQNNSSSGEDINIVDAWWRKQYGSRNEIIAIVDDGVQITHEDLKDNIVPNLSRNLVTGGNDPSPQFYDADGDYAPEYHGTNVASLAAARGGNGIGISGTAPRAGLVGIRLLGNFTATNVKTALNHKPNQIDIYNNSWGAPDNAQLNGLTPLEEDALKHGIRNGRGGKGSIYVFAAGNGRGDGDDSNFDGYANSPYTIAVAASNNLGKQAWYSENGSNLWINAPSSDDIQNIMITEPYILDSYETPRYSQDFGGTSATAPQVSGVIALMLEQNPKLSWLDVQHILAETAFKNDPADTGWAKNAAGYWINRKYGFGRVDASAASQLAADWDLLPPQTTVTASKQPDILIPDNDTNGITSIIEIQDDLSIDYVEVEFTSDHIFWGDLEISLKSPEGTRSILAETGYGSENGARDGDAYKNGWRFGVARLLGESSQGNWTLTVKDNGLEDTGRLKKWSVKVYGSESNVVKVAAAPDPKPAPDPTPAPAPAPEPEPTAAEKLLDKCITKYPQVMGTKVGEAYACQDGLLCQKTTGGESIITITTVAVKADNSGDLLSYLVYGNWYTVSLSNLNHCN